MIANYETDARTPDDETLAEIAEALGVTPQSLQDRNLDSVQDVLEVLFQMDEAGFGIEPVETKNRIVPTRSSPVSAETTWAPA